MKYIFCLCFLFGLTMAQYNLQNDMRDKHNNVRTIHQVAGLTISTTLVSYATQCATYYAQKNMIDHSCPQAKGNGENLAWSMSSAGPPTQQAAANTAFNSWYNENKDYNYNTGGPKDSSKVIGHFTQVVWKNSKQLGCGSAQNVGAKRTFICCLYSPPGNYIGEYLKNVFPPK